MTGKIVERQWDDEFEQFKYVIHVRSSDDEAIGAVAKVDAKPGSYIITTYVLWVEKNPSELCGLCAVGNAQLVLRPQKIKVKNEYFTVENIPMHECYHCGGRYFSRDVAMTLDQIRLKFEGIKNFV